MKIFKNKKGLAGFLIFIVFIVIIGVVFVLFGKQIELTRDIHTKLLGDRFSWDFSFNKEKAIVTTDLVMPPIENTWCKLQEIQVGTSNEDYTRDRIIGWDNIDSCCVRSVEGYNCALKRNIEVSYCYTGNVGSEIKWLTVEGYFENKDLYREFIDDLDKSEIVNKPCDLTKYPGQLKI